MRKIFSSFLLVFASICVSFAQNYAEINVIDIENGSLLEFCYDEYDGVIVHGRPECELNEWYIGSQYSQGDSIIVYSAEWDYFNIQHRACGQVAKLFTIEFPSFVPNPFDETLIWKRFGETITLFAASWGYDIIWSTGDTTEEIQVTEPGVYSVTITDICGSETYSIEVRDNVEIALATCDLESNLNMVTWSTTEEQAEYVDHLNVKRDGMIVNTANYSDGVFIDNIGSDAAARTYTLVAVASDGTECPIESYQKETIHMSYVIGVNHTIEVGWNSPTGYELVGYNICEWNPNGKDGDLTIIDFVGAGVNTYTCSEEQFDGGMVVVQGVEASKTENRLLSNRSKDYIGLNELTKQNLKVYPNPSDGTFTVEGAKNLTIYNILGQIMATSYDEDGIHTFNLTPGLYFVKSDEGMKKKVVVQ